MSLFSLTTVDTQGLILVQALRHPLLDVVFSLVTWCGSLWLLVPAAVGYAAWRWQPDGWRSALRPVLTLAGASLSVMALKATVLRPRPELFTALVTLPTDFSFPSGHAAQAAAFAFALCWRASAWQRGMLGGLVLLVAASRLYLQVHYPSDVLAGVLLGGAWAGLLARLLISVKRGAQ